MAMVASEQVRVEAQEILRHARVAQIKRQTLGLAPIGEFPRGISVSRPKRPRAMLVIQPKYARLLQACMCRRTAGPVLSYRPLLSSKS
jgi:hypothetical protein